MKTITEVQEPKVTEKVNSLETLETVLKELEPQLPLGVHYLGPLLGGKVRYSKDVDAPKEAAANPVRPDLWFSELGFCPLVVVVELFRPILGGLGGWLYSVHFVVDSLLTAKEVHSKVREAAAVLEAQPGKKCTWKAYNEECYSVFAELDQWEGLESLERPPNPN